MKQSSVGRGVPRALQVPLATRAEWSLRALLLPLGEPMGRGEDEGRAWQGSKDSCMCLGVRLERGFAALQLAAAMAEGGGWLATAGVMSCWWSQPLAAQHQGRLGVHGQNMRCAAMLAVVAC